MQEPTELIQIQSSPIQPNAPTDSRRGAYRRIRYPNVCNPARESARSGSKEQQEGDKATRSIRAGRWANARTDLGAGFMDRVPGACNWVQEFPCAFIAAAVIASPFHRERETKFLAMGTWLIPPPSGGYRQAFHQDLVGYDVWERREQRIHVIGRVRIRSLQETGEHVLWMPSAGPGDRRCNYSVIDPFLE